MFVPPEKNDSDMLEQDSFNIFVPLAATCKEHVE
jgi:hypothetical protein